MKRNSPTRRQFIKSTALAAASAPFLSELVTRSFAAESERKLGFALVGLGSLSTGQLAPALRKTKYCRLAGIVTGTPSKAERWKAQYNIPDANIYNYDTMVKMADNPDIDVVYVVTPNALHAEHTIKAAKAGKHVLCEKPMEVSPEKCQSMIDACKSAGRLLAIGYRSQFDPTHLECIRLAREKVLGAVKSVDAGFGFRIGNPNQWRLDRALSGGGPLMDVGIYALQTSRYITGQEPQQVVSATSANTNPDKFKNVEESINWELKFPGGVTATGKCSYSSGVNEFTVQTEQGSFGMKPAYNYNRNRGFRSDGQEMRFPELDQFAAEMDDFAQCIFNNKPSKVSGEEGLRDLKIMMAIYESAKTGKPVQLG